MTDLPPGALPKGARVFARQLGKPDVRGTVTWVGPNRYGPGVRYGVKDDAGKTYWFDGENVESEGPAGGDQGRDGVKKGSRVRFVDGDHEGVVGDVYICGPIGRIGVRDDNEDTYWAEREQLELEG